MQNLVRWLGSLSTAKNSRDGFSRAPVSPAGAEPGGQKPAIEWSDPTVSPAVMTLALAYVLGIGLIDFTIGRSLNLDLFYLVGCALAGWAGGWMALGVALAASGLVLFAEARPLGALTWVEPWNLLCRVLEFAMAGWLALRFHQTTRGLEKSVRERTRHTENAIEKHKETARVLRETLRLLKQVTENIADVFWVTNAPRTKVEYVSQEFENLWGERCQALFDDPGTWLRRVHPDDRERVAAAISQKQLRGDYDEEYRVVRPDGVVRWVRDRAFPVKNEIGAVCRLVGIAEDITVQRRTQRLLRIERDLAVTLSSTNNMQVAISGFLEAVVQIENVDCAGIHLLDADSGELVLRGHKGLPDELALLAARPGKEAAETQIARSGAATFLQGEQVPRARGTLWGGFGLKSLLLLPLQYKGTVLGLIGLGSFRHAEMAAEIRVGLESVSAHVGAAIARMVAEERSRRSEAHVRSVVTSAPVALLAADERGRVLFEDGKALQAMGFKPGEHLKQQVLEVYREDPSMLDDLDRALAGEEFTSVVEFGGTLMENHYSATRTEDGKAAGFVAVGVDVTERFRLQRQILEISDREQARIGQDVHDGLCQQLIGVALNARSLQRSLAGRELTEAVAANRICVLLDEAITESRRVCRGLYPVRLSTEGLVPALEELANNVSERYKKVCRLKADDQHFRCPERAAIHLYRIAQEAVNNAIKHGGGERIEIVLSTRADQVELTVKDEGKGFARTPQVQPDGRSGMGLHIMDYRARTLGGRLHVSHEEAGTAVCCRVPKPCA